MQKNVAGQKIGAQMITAADGTAFTGSVTVSVTGDAGTQATGSVGAGACTHEGNGYHTYAPAQVETNYDLIAFTFTGTGAIPATVQVMTTAPNFNATSISSGGVVDANVLKTDGATLHNYDGTLAAVTAATDITFPATDAYGNSVPNDARYAYCIFLLVSGTGAGQLLITKGKTGTRKFAFLASQTPVDPSTDTTYRLIGPLASDIRFVNDVLVNGIGTSGSPWGP